MYYKWKSICNGNSYLYKDYDAICIFKYDDGNYGLEYDKLNIVINLETKDFDIAVSKSKIVLSYELQKLSKGIEGFIHDYRKNDWE